MLNKIKIHTISASQLLLMAFTMMNLAASEAGCVRLFIDQDFIHHDFNGEEFIGEEFIGEEFNDPEVIAQEGQLSKFKFVAGFMGVVSLSVVLFLEQARSVKVQLLSGGTAEKLDTCYIDASLIDFFNELPHIEKLADGGYMLMGATSFSDVLIVWMNSSCTVIDQKNFSQVWQSFNQKIEDGTLVFESVDFDEDALEEVADAGESSSNYDKCYLDSDEQCPVTDSSWAVGLQKHGYFSSSETAPYDDQDEDHSYSNEW